MISSRSRAAVLTAFLLALPGEPSRAAAAPLSQLTDGESPPTGEPTSEKGVPPVLETVRVATPPTIDGRLDDAVWANAPVASGFTQLRPDPGTPASQRTDVRVLHDDDAIYVSAHMFDTAPDSIVAQLGRRDNQIYSDWFYVALDSYFDRRTAFVFGVNPRGVMVDLLLHNDTEEDESWDAVWDAAAERTPDGWTAEFRIPLSQLRFSRPDEGEQRWGANFLRKIARHGEESFWAPLRPDDGRLVSAFGELRGLGDLKPPRRLEVMPYAVASATGAPGDAENPFHDDISPFGGVGADIKAGITSDLTLTATINPDFGQVEADPSVVNLTAFETFFPEKRPFFVEGVDIFRFGLGLGDGDLGNESLFYSRRIGRAPQGDVEGDYTDAPDATTILAAAKLSGKTQNGWSIGILDAVTAEEHGDYVLGDVEGETPIEPRTNYGVARVIKDFRDGKSAVGGIFTATNRSLPKGGALDWLRRSAYTGGLDFRHRFFDERYQITGSVVGSRITGSPEAIAAVQTAPVHYFQRPDADYVEYDPSRTSLQGLAAKAELFKIQGKWRWALLGMTLTPGFEANDLGFQTNGDLALGVIWAGYNQYESGDLFRRWNIGTNLWTGTNYGGDLVSLGGNVNGSFQLTSFWGGFGSFNFEAPTYSTSMLRGGPAFLRPASGNISGGLYTDNRKAVNLSFHANTSWQAETSGGSWSVRPGIEVRPSDNVEVLLGPSYSRSRSALQYVATRAADGTDEWVLGTVDRTTLSMTARLNYTFSPTLSLQLYAQPYIATGDYDDFKIVEDPRASAFGDRVHLLGAGEIAATTVDDRTEYAVDLDADGETEFTFGDPSFNFKQLRSNVVLRWEYRPGSTVFLVWSQGRTDYTRDGRFRFDRDVDALFDAAGTNVLLIKMSYWLGL